MPSAIVIGSSAGIGLAVAKRLVAAGWTVTGLARRDPGLALAGYRHVVADVRSPDYRDAVTALAVPDAVIYSAGVGVELDVETFAREAEAFEVNLLGAVITAEVMIPRMIAAGRGHFLGLSSQADQLIDRGAPSYAASKAGLTSYLEGLAKACKPRGVHVTNVRFGFVDTEMSQGTSPRPFLITAERAAELIERCLVTRPVRFTYPRKMAALLWLVR